MELSKSLKIGTSLVLMLGLVGCASAPKPKSQSQPEEVGIICLPMVTYTKKEQAQAANEAKAYAQFEPQLMSMLQDYAVMREENKECMAVSSVEDHTSSTSTTK